MADNKGSTSAKLTAKQELFIQEYMKDQNATAAAIRAGYSERSANNIGPENLLKPIVRNEIDRRLEQRAKDNGITADYVLNSLKDIADSAEEKTNDRIKSLELLGKHLKLFTEKVEADVSGNMNITITGEVKEWAK